MTEPADGAWLHRFASDMFPLCRSITGDGLRQTLRKVHAHLPLDIREVPSGSRAFDWEVPDEWNIESASLRAPDGSTVAEFADHNLHLMNYSVPAAGELSLEELMPHLHSMPSQPDWIPYRTSYYRRQWGFCITDRARRNLQPGTYRYEIRGMLRPGSLTYGECLIRGRQRKEVLLFTHACHPSLANDNLSGIAVLTALGRWLAAEPRRYSYRLVFAPGTIGSLCWLHANQQRLGQIHHGLVLGLLGDGAPLTYKQSREGTFEIDTLVPHVLKELAPDSRILPFEPYGYDERQFCSPGFNLPVGRLTRSVNDGYAEYHSSADDLSLISPNALAESLNALRQIVIALEDNRRYVNRNPCGEPLLGKRGLYGSVGGSSPRSMEMALLWVLNQSDGRHSLLDIARRSGIPLVTVAEAAKKLKSANLLGAKGR